MILKYFRHNLKRVSTLILISVISAGIAGCNQNAATVTLSPSTGSLATSDTGTIHPSIQSVYPGKLQTLDIPESFPTDISPYSPGIVVVFSHLMENDSSEMSSFMTLVEVTTGYPEVAINITPTATSKYFNIIPSSGSLKPDTQYILRIYKNAFAETAFDTVSVSRSSNVATIITAAAHGLTDNEMVSVSGFGTLVPAHSVYNASYVNIKVVNTTTFTYSNTGSDEGTTADTDGRVAVYYRTLVFDNLVNSPATTLSPADPVYVDYEFQTGNTVTDLIPPTLLSTNPSNSAVNVPYDLSPGYIEIIFNDTNNSGNSTLPMINPSTVNESSVTLYDVTNTAYISGYLTCDYTDAYFRTFRFYPYDLSNILTDTNYRLSISIPPYNVLDFAGNAMTRADVFFTTGN